MAKKKKTPHQQSFSPKSYLRHGSARKLPIHECRIPKNWKELMKFPLVVARLHTNGHVTYVNLLVDLLCTGIKDVTYVVNTPIYEYEKIVNHYQEIDLDMLSVDYLLVHNIIYEALAFAEDHGIEPHREFSYAEMILDADTDDIPMMDIPLGENGKPLLLLHENTPRNSYYQRQLEKHAGPGNYLVMNNDEHDFQTEEYEQEDDDPEYWDTNQWTDFLLTPPHEISPIDKALKLLYLRGIYQPYIADKQKDDPEYGQQDVKITYDTLRQDGLSTKQMSLNKKYFIKLEDAKKGKNLDRLISNLRKDIDSDPGNYPLYNYLINSLIMNENMSEIEALHQLVREKFPDYLFGKLTYAKHLFQIGRHQEIPALFDGHTTLTAAFPNRSVFHSSEFFNFHIILGNYFLKEKNIEQAYYHYDTIINTEDLDLHEQTMSFFFTIQLEMAESARRLIGEAQTDQKRMENLIQVLSA